MTESPSIESLILPVKTRIGIATEYNIDVRTLKRWLLLHGLQLPPGAIPPKYQREIYQTLGPPPSLKG